VLRKRMEKPSKCCARPVSTAATASAAPSLSFPGTCSSARPGRARPPHCSTPACAFRSATARGERALQGVGGTRNCDWWFTDEACCSTPRAAIRPQESDREADAAAWLGFLDLLKRFRPRQPLNGVIVTLSATDLVHWNDEEMARYAAHVRARLRELYGRLGVRLPIYVLVTKADLLAGFMEFSASWTATGRAQVWGNDFPGVGDLDQLRARCDEEFARLERPVVRDASRAPPGRARPSAPRRDLSFPAAVPRRRAPGVGLHGKHVSAAAGREKCPSCAGSTSPAARRREARSTACSARSRAAST
jgi:hypothetical protein